MKHNLKIHRDFSYSPISLVSSTEKSLYELYNNLFEGVVADTPELIDECYKLRYQVYCIEHPFEDPDPAKGEYERDEFDGQAVHALLRYRPTGEFIGTVRLIVDGEEAPHHAPIRGLCDAHGVALPDSYQRKPFVEISRFCILKDFRRRLTDSMYSSSYTPQELAEMRSRVIPYMALGLIQMIYVMGRARGVTQAAAVMEPSLIRLLSKLSIYFHPIGPQIEYHGKRQICYITACGIYRSLATERTDVLELITGRRRMRRASGFYLQKNQ